MTGDPEITVEATSFIKGLTADDQATIAKWELRREGVRASGEHRHVPWPFTRPRYEIARRALGSAFHDADPCTCGDDPFGVRRMGYMSHERRIEHVAGLAVEEQCALADYFRERALAEPPNWKRLRRWTESHFSPTGREAAHVHVDRVRDPPLWFDRAAYVLAKQSQIDAEERRALERPPEEWQRRVDQNVEYEVRDAEERRELLRCLEVEERVLASMPEPSTLAAKLVDAIPLPYVQFDVTESEYLDQKGRVAHLQFRLSGDRSPRALTLEAVRAEALDDVARDRAQVEERAEKVAAKIADQTDNLRALLVTMRAEDW